MVINSKDKAFDGTMMLIVGVISVLCLIPLIYIAAVSFSSVSAITAQKVFLWPVEPTAAAYQAVLGDKAMLNSMIFTIWLTIAGAALSIFMTVLAAYPLTKKGLKGRNIFLLMIVFTMYFGGGTIPEYMLVRNLGLLDTFWSLMLPYCLSAFNLIILKTFFQNLPESLEESAYLDGASHFTILLRIVLPLSLPVLATLTLFYAVGRWNGFQDALIFVTKQNLYPIQLKLYMLVYANQMSDVTAIEGAVANNLPTANLKAASVMFGTIPILLAYPWLQRYFISGIMIGAIKG